MPSIAQDIQRILDLAGEYSKESSPAMEERTSTAEALAGKLVNALAEMPGMDVLGDLHLLVKAGGRQANFSPVPWVRVYSKRYAPTAQEGIYLVYLFAADGSTAYLSLNQGTSELRSGRTRTINDQRILFSRAAQARSALGDLMESEGTAGATLSIDLASKTLSSRDSKLRARAYEDANILAQEYFAGQIPNDEQLLSDLYGMLPLLAQLYGEVPIQPLSAFQSPSNDSQSGAPQTTGKTNSQGRLLDSAVRKKIELHAEDRAEDHFSDLGWEVARVGHLKLGYDLACTKENGEILHVEVKGTQTRGQKVILTENEVRHIREASQCGAEHALYVVSNIKVSTQAGIKCEGGDVTRKLPWSIDEEDLTPTEYSYQIPT
jgi:hypothetical protein